MSKTVKEIFHDGIASGNWSEIRKVYQAITGEEAPPTRQPMQKSLDDILNSTVMTPEELHDPEHYVNPNANPLPANVIEVSETSIEAQREAEALVPMGHDMIQTKDGDVDMEDFRVVNTGAKIQQREGDKVYCRQEEIAKQDRVNQFSDDGENVSDPKGAMQAFQEELVTRHPELGSKGVSTTDRDTGSLVEVQCSLCEKWERVSPMLASRYDKDPEKNTYRCNDCNTPTGRDRVLRQQRRDEMDGKRRPNRRF